MTKYKEYTLRMLEENKAAFASFKKIHDLYRADTDKYQSEFNREGEKVLKIIREWENRLCLQSEKGGFGKFTTALSEKFQAEVKNFFPLIDHVGIRVFSLKQIKLF